jgi:hypothetical protein
MRTIRAIVLVMSLSLPVCGCTASRQAEKASLGAGPGQEPPARDSTSGKPQDRPAYPSLERHGFTILGFRAIRDSFGQVSVIGEIRNTSSASRGVELQASLRDAAGRLLSVGHFYPASYRNIVPDETWPFTYSFGRQEDAVEAELRIVGAFRTMDLPNVDSATP